MLTVAQSNTDLGAGVALMVVGMVVVFGALVLIGLIVMGVRRVLDRPVHTPTPQASPRDPMPAGISPERIAVIAAAATAAVGKPVRVHRVVMLGEQGGSAWARGGRRTIMGSHRPFRPGPR
ncbi:MAG: OadG family transporter subunit [Planctomycetota bacterium]